MTEWAVGRRNALTDIRGIRVGHWSDRRRGTGCTAILCEAGAAAAVDVRGGAPGTRETDVLAVTNLVRACHGIVLCGGSAFGLAACDGAMRYLSERGAGFGTTARPVPIVSGAVVFDLGLGSSNAAPDAAAGYRAARAATGGGVAEGTVGAGTGVTVAKLLGHARALKGGLGTASLSGPRGIIAGALAVTNSVGTIVDPETGESVAAPRADSGGFVELPEVLEQRPDALEALVENTTLVVVATNATLAPEALQRIAYAAHDGIARTITPAHTLADGDTAFALSTGALEITPADVATVHVLAQRAAELSLLRSVRLATGLHGVPSAAEWTRQRA